MLFPRPLAGSSTSQSTNSFVIASRRTKPRHSLWQHTHERGYTDELRRFRPRDGAGRSCSARGAEGRRDVGGRIRNWILVMGLAAIAAIAAWPVGEHTMEYAKPSKEAAENYPGLNGFECGNARSQCDQRGSDLRCIGWPPRPGHGARRWALQAVRSLRLGAAAGLILGAAAGGLPSLVVMPWQWRHRNDDPFNAELLSPLLVHLALWTVRVSPRDWRSAIGRQRFQHHGLVEAGLAGLIGAVLGTFVFEIVGALLFPADFNPRPIRAHVRHPPARPALRRGVRRAWV